MAAFGSTLFVQGCMSSDLPPSGLGGSGCPDAMWGLFRYEGDAFSREEPVHACESCLAADDDHVYWLDPSEGTLRRRGRGEGGTGVVLAELGVAPSQLLVTERTVYWQEWRLSVRGDGLMKIRAIPKP
jgi:hypothetical protein